MDKRAYDDCREDTVDYQLNDDRLAWLAVRDEVSRRSRRGSWFGKLLDAMGGRQYLVARDGTVRDIGGVAKQRSSSKMGRYARAVDHTAQSLDKQERQVLRSTGKVPDWFLDKVQERYNEIRKQR